MAGRPLRPATDCRLGEPLPHQLANPTSAHPITRGLAIPRFLQWPVRPRDVCGISQPFGWLFPITGQIPKHYSPVRRSSARIATPVTARLACVKHAASVQSEPGSNSSLDSFELSTKQSESKAHRWTFGHSVIMRPTGRDRREFPHKLPARFLNSTSATRAEERAEEYSPAALLVNIRTHAYTASADPCDAAFAEGAHYRGRGAPVNGRLQGGRFPE